ncbi:hypothetical protein F183_A14900 [Bryobacterales bacterium F-183]|nr:hypothetical protein F183_A14900 [Bryobacterales bacterium F-183]
MSKTFPIFFGIAIALLALGAWLGWFGTSDSRLTMTGEVLKVRTQEMTPETTLVIADFRMKNESNIGFNLREAVLIWTDAQGKDHECDHVAGSDLQRILTQLPQIGPAFNKPFVIGDKVESKAMMDRMTAGVAQASEADFEKRKSIRLRLTDIDHKSFVFEERAAAAK